MPLGSSSAAPVMSPGPSTCQKRRRPFANPALPIRLRCDYDSGSQRRKDKGMSVLGWIVLGLIGAVVGGWLFSYFGHHDPMRFNLVSRVIAIIGAVIVLLIWHAITGRG